MHHLERNKHIIEQVALTVYQTCRSKYADNILVLREKNLFYEIIFLLDKQELGLKGSREPQLEQTLGIYNPSLILQKKDMDSGEIT